MKKLKYKATKKDGVVNLTPVIDDHIAINLKLLFRILLWFDSENVMTVKQIKVKFLSRKKNKDISWPMAESALQRLTNEFNYLKFAEHNPGSELNTFCLEPLGEEKIKSIIDGSISRTNHDRRNISKVAIWFSVIGVIVNCCFSIYKSVDDYNHKITIIDLNNKVDSLQNTIYLINLSVNQRKEKDSLNLSSKN